MNENLQSDRPEVKFYIDPRLNVVMEIAHREQEFYWHRIAAFAVMHAGLFVLAASTEFNESKLVHLMALFLATIWVYVQIQSRVYVNRIKPQYHRLCKQAGVQYEYSKWYEHFQSRQWHKKFQTWYEGFQEQHKRLQKWLNLSSTDLGVATTWLVLVLWIMLFCAA